MADCTDGGRVAILDPPTMHVAPRLLRCQGQETRRERVRRLARSGDANPGAETRRRGYWTTVILPVSRNPPASMR